MIPTISVRRASTSLASSWSWEDGAAGAGAAAACCCQRARSGAKTYCARSALRSLKARTPPPGMNVGLSHVPFLTSRAASAAHRSALNDSAAMRRISVLRAARCGAGSDRADSDAFSSSSSRVEQPSSMPGKCSMLRIPESESAATDTPVGAWPVRYRPFALASAAIAKYASGVSSLWIFRNSTPVRCVSSTAAFACAAVVIW
jgi:hypothetical protein